MVIERVGIVGSGIMSSGVAEVAAKAGYEVVIRSREQESADDLLLGIAKSLRKQVDKGRLEEKDAEEARRLVSATTDLEVLGDCDLVLESVVEELGVKMGLFRELDAVMKPDAILASNTSTLSVRDLAEQTNRSDRVCGIHFFNPAPVMKLVEIVEADTTSAKTLAEAEQFAERCGKNAIHVKDRAGFVVNALLFPYLNNAVRMMEDGIATKQAIDIAMKDGCGFPMGPFELLDLVGLDTSLSIIEALHKGLGDPNYKPCATLEQLVEEGKLGRKSGEGFYVY